MADRIVEHPDRRAFWFSGQNVIERKSVARPSAIGGLWCSYWTVARVRQMGVPVGTPHAGPYRPEH
ncbi:hypothetical protein [Nocardia vaccinii]|uniref:hypothetical protein n=1 Tax=Nocardia vaccinii TaxID=1822 RepID=UPI00082D6A68|nr:hypothetical protein [Nocardia vaccinii]